MRYTWLPALILCCAVTSGTAAFAQIPPADSEPAAIEKKTGDAWTVNFKDSDIQAVISQISAITGENYIIPAGVTGKISVVSQVPLKRNEIKELLLTVLHINGFTITKSGRALVVEPVADAKKNTAPVDAAGTMTGEAFVVRILPLKYANPNELLQAVQPLVSDIAVIKNLPDSNALLVADKADNVQKIADIVFQLDVPEGDQIESVKLTKGWVGDLMPLLEKLAPREMNASGRPTESPLRIIGDERSNTIMLRGDAEGRARIHALIIQLEESASDTSDVQVIPLHNADAVKMADMLKDMFSNNPKDATPGAMPPIPVSIKAHPSSNALVVHGSPEVVAQVRRILEQLDVQRTQVLIEAAIVEINDELLNQLGVQFGAGQAAITSHLAASSLVAGNASSLSSPPTSLASYLQGLSTANSGLIGSGLTASLGSVDKFTALIQALAADSHANLLSTPSITTVNNEEAKILVGQNVPFLTGSFAQATSTTGGVNPFNTIQRQDIGVTLKVTPQISENNHVLLKVDQEVSSIAPTTVAGAADIITNKRSIDTTVLAMNGQTIALGGLISDNKNSTKSKIPILGDIPVLGLLFQSTEDDVAKSDLVVFLRPTIIANTDDVDAMNLRQYNGLWEIDLGKGADPLTVGRLGPELNKLYTPQNTYVPLPWLAADNQKPVPPIAVQPDPQLKVEAPVMPVTVTSLPAETPVAIAPLPQTPIPATAADSPKPDSPLQ